MKVKIVNGSAFNLPEYKTVGSAGMDLQADFTDMSQIRVEKGGFIAGDGDDGSHIYLENGSRVVIPTNLQIQLPDGFEAQIRPRSGHSLKTGIEVVLGTIDSDFIGNVGIIVKNNTGDAVEIGHGERIAQMVISPVVQAEWDLAKALEPTVRGDGGFGSTGTK